MALSNNLTATVNFIALLCSIPIIASGLWLASKPDNECVHLFRWPVVVLGFLVLVISLMGFVGAYWYKEGLLALYLCCMAILITLLLVLLIFAFVVTRPDGSVMVQGRGYKEYRVEGFSSWLRNHVVDDESWAKIRNCLIDSNFCAKLNSQFVGAPDFFVAHISPLQESSARREGNTKLLPTLDPDGSWGKCDTHQSGCCKPPTICGYHYVNPTMWVDPTNPGSDPDCVLWSSDQSQLCYNCNSCKAGLLGNLRKEWRKANIILIIAVVVLIFVYIIACSAFRNAQTEDLFRKYKP